MFLITRTFFLTVGQNNFGNKIPFFSFPFFAVVVLESLLTLQIRLVLFMLKFVNQGLCKMRTFSLKFPWDCVNSRWSWSKETSLEIHGGWMRYQSSSDFVNSSLQNHLNLLGRLKDPTLLCEVTINFIGKCFFFPPAFAYKI